MGWMLLLVVLAPAVALLVPSLVTKRLHRRVRAIAWISVFAAFVLLVVTQLLEWSPRYSPLALLLLGLAAVGAVALIRRRPEEGAGRPVWRFAGVVVATVLALVPVALFPRYDPLPTTGAHGVATEVETLVDASRVETLGVGGGPRRLTVEYWYPDASAGSFPLVVFSHGGTGIRSSNETLFRELASHGYVVASIDHTYHALFATDVDGGVTWVDGDFVRQLREEDASANPVQSLEYYREWMGVRLPDIGFVVDRVRERAGSAGALAYVDAGRIGVMGHSLGGSAALGVGRLRDDVDAVVALEAPFLTEIRGVDADGFVWSDEPYPLPVLLVYSDSSWEHLGEWPQYAMNERLRQDAGGKVFSEHLAGVGHFGLTDLSLTSPLVTRFLDGRGDLAPEEALTRLNVLCLPFLDRYVRDAGG